MADGPKVVPASAARIQALLARAAEIQAEDFMTDAGAELGVEPMGAVVLLFAHDDAAGGAVLGATVQGKTDRDAARVLRMALQALERTAATHAGAIIVPSGELQ